MQLTELDRRFPLHGATQKKGYHWLVVLTVCIGAFMAALDASIINLALPSLVRQFGVTMNGVEWVSLSYLLTLAALVVTFGRLADIWGRRWMYAGGFLVFLVSSWMCGMSPGLPFLLFSRVLQAVGAAMLQANSVSIITAATPARHRGKAIGLQASAQGIGLSLGPVIGGALLAVGSWRWLFYINIPIGIAGTIMAVCLLPRDAKRKHGESFDYWGFLFMAPALVMMMYVLNMGSKIGWESPVILLCAWISLLAFAAFIREERKAGSPILDLTLFKDRLFLLGNVSSFLSFTVMYGVLLLSPFLMERELHMNTWMSGVLLAFVPVGMTVFTPVSGVLSDRFGVRVPTIAGMGIITAGCLLLIFVGADRPIILYAGGLLLIGIGMGVFTPPNNSSVMGSVPGNRLGVAGAILNMSRTVGMGMGISLSGMLFQIWQKVLPLKGQQLEADAFRASFAVIALLSALGWALTVLRRRKQPRYTEEFIEYYI